MRVWWAGVLVATVLAGAGSGGAGGSARAQEGQTGGATAATPAPSSAAASGNAANGKIIWTKYGCYQCHGYVGQGGGGPRLAPNPIAIANFIRIVRHPPNQMPPYTEKLVTDQELRDIHAFLGTIPKPPSVDTIPLLQERK
jgi:mono/diheme cytochrome c family protein